MKRIGIITWYWGNYGSILQAYALCEYLSMQGFDCEVVRHHVNGDFRTQVRYRLSHDSLSSNAANIKNKAAGMIYGRIQKDERAERMRTFERFVEENLRLSERAYTNQDYTECTDYDAYICGSDQIWNPSFTFLSPFYWLAFLPEGKDAIAYAPSLGTAEFGNDDRETVKRYLLRFKAISTREENSGKMLETIDPRIRVSHVSDPTFLPGADFWKSKVKSTKSEKKYLFAYLIKGNDRQREYIEAVARERQLELVTYPYLENHRITKSERTWGDVRCFGDDPFDFLTKIYNAELIITDSFHCSVFSLQFRKDFYALKKCGDTTGQFNRIEQLLKACGMSGRMISEDKPFRRAETDFDASDRAIAALREESRAYLDRALS